MIIPPPTSQKLIGRDINSTSELTNKQTDDLKLIIDLCDGIICPGGDEFFDYDLKVIQYCYEINKPLLGICLGMQAMSCLFNGSIQDFNNLSHKSEEKYVHEVKINKESKLYNILKKEVINVNSRHKSYIVSTDLDAVGLSNNNVVEAVEDKSKKFFIGIQWHPESMIEYDITENILFSYFIDSCRR